MNDRKSKPRIFASRCLGFAACRWNGVTIPSETVSLLKPHVDFVTLCPEMEIGLGAPRDPIRLVGGKDGTALLQPATGREVTSEMKRFADSAIQALPALDGVILKAKSPSCGIRDVKVYSGAEKSPVIGKTSGMFGAAVIETFQGIPIEDEARLSNFRLREHFLIHLFTMRRFRSLREDPSIHGLVRFHARHKFILMAYNQSLMREMGRLVARPEHRSPEEMIDSYCDPLRDAFKRIPPAAAHCNILEHSLGYVSKKISKQERTYFVDSIRRFRERKIPLSVLLGIMQAWIIRFDIDYLKEQFYFSPFPESLVQVSDSGKGRTLKH